MTAGDFFTTSDPTGRDPDHALQLLLDIGNTSVKWALWDRGTLGPMAGARHHGALPIDLLAAWDELTDVGEVLVGQVGPPAVLDAIARIADARWGAPVRRVETAAQAHGVRIAYAEPARLGVDRFLGLIGAHDLAARDRKSDPAASGPSLIVDAGTAITFDLLCRDGRHLGGLILPGVTAMREALFAGTQIPRYEPAQPDTAWACDTAEAISAASIQAPAALAGRLWARLATETGETPRLLLTGGDAERLLPALDRPAALVPDLVLRGLARFA